MMKIKAIEKMAKLTGPMGLKLAKNSPEILVVAGVVGILASAVLACKATLKVEDVLDEHAQKADKIKTVRQDVIDGERAEDVYTEQDQKKDMAVTYVQTGLSLVKLYAPAVILGGLSIACILKSHSIMKTRNVALMAAYKTLDQGFKAYRKRVVEEHGEQTDYMYKNGLRSETIVEEIKDENGKTKKVKKEILVNDDPSKSSMYARFFDESNPDWGKSPEYNKLFLKSVQNYMNDLLITRGHVFLNEAYDALGMERSKAGAIVGWVIGEGRENCIDFGIFDGGRERARAFVNGDERSILLDFNVDGVVYNFLD